VPLIVVDALFAPIFEDADLRVFRKVGKHRVWRFQVTEAPGESEVVLRGEMLVAKDDHQMIE
jgi:hypothetical protein